MWARGGSCSHLGVPHLRLELCDSAVGIRQRGTVLLVLCLVLEQLQVSLCDLLREDTHLRGELFDLLEHPVVASAMPRVSMRRGRAMWGGISLTPSPPSYPGTRIRSPQGRPCRKAPIFPSSSANWRTALKKENSSSLQAKL